MKFFNENCFHIIFRQVLTNSKNNVRKNKKLQVWANLKRSQFDGTLHWAARKLKSFGAFEDVDDCYISGKFTVNHSKPPNWLKWQFLTF